jgi:membrane fusion protein (multidrug efflux system)
MDKRKKILTGIGAVVIIGAFYFIYEHLSFVETDNAHVEAHTLLLSAKISGYIKEVNVQDGQKVKKGDVLVQIDDRDYKAIADSSRSELLSLEARKRDAEKNFQRLKDLYAQSVVSAQQYDAASANYNEIKAKYDSAAAKLAQAELNVENAQIVAPSDGIAAKAAAEIGQLAAPGTPLVGFVSSESRWITANFKETDIEDVKIGNKVDITVDAISGQKYTGEVESISSATGATFTLLPPDNATGNFTKVVQRIPVKIKILNLPEAEYDKLQAGLSAIVKVHIR